MKSPALLLTCSLAFAVSLLAACSPSPSEIVSQPALPGESDYVISINDLGPALLEDGRSLRVVATTNIAADLVSAIGGDFIQLTPLLPTGADPHGYAPAPRDLQAVADADIVFVSGFNLEEGLGETLQSVAGDVPIVSLSEGIQPRAFASTPQLSMGEDEHLEENTDEEESVEHVEHAEAQHEGIDPHVWLDPTNVIHWAENAARALAALDPEQAASYNASASAHVDNLQALDSWILAEFSSLPQDGRRMVTDHEAFGYFADRYELDIIGAVIPAYSSTASTSPQDLAALLAAIQQFDVHAIFVGVSVNPTMAERVAEDSGIELIPLYTGSLSPADGPAATYLEMMTYDVNAITGALNGERQ